MKFISLFIILLARGRSQPTSQPTQQPSIDPSCQPSQVSKFPSSSFEYSTLILRSVLRYIASVVNWAVFIKSFSIRVHILLIHILSNWYLIFFNICHYSYISFPSNRQCGHRCSPALSRQCSPALNRVNSRVHFPL